LLADRRVRLASIAICFPADGRQSSIYACGGLSQAIAIIEPDKQANATHIGRQ
jgi:hypothetical protein